MEDYEIRDVMNRASAPDAHVEFGLTRELNDTQPYDCRRLRVIVTNQSTQVINRFKLILRLKNIGWAELDHYEVTDLLELYDDETFTYSYWSGETENLDVVMVYQSKEVLFPKESTNIGGYRIKWAFLDNSKWNDEQWISNARKERWSLEWTLYADNMPPNQGSIMVCDLAIMQRS